MCINPHYALKRYNWVVTAALLSVILLYIGDKIGGLHLRTPANTIDPLARDRKHTTAIYRQVLSVTPEVTAALLLVIYRVLRCRPHVLLCIWLSCYVSGCLVMYPAVLLCIWLSCYVSSQNENNQYKRQRDR